MGIWDALLGGAFALAGAYIFLQAQTFPNLKEGYPGPGLFPQILGVLLIVAGVGLAGHVIARRAWSFKMPLAEHPLPEKINLALIVLAVIFYIVFVDTLGFIPVALLVLIGLMWRLGVSRRWSIVLGIGLTLLIYLLFNRILHVPLPSGLLKEWL